jgi:hypothetical protein
MMIRSSLHCIKLPNQINLIVSFKVTNLTTVCNGAEVQTIDDSVLRQSAELRALAIIKWP